MAFKEYFSNKILGLCILYHNDQITDLFHNSWSGLTKNWIEAAN
jgi:hypothetical protein